MNDSIYDDFAETYIGDLMEVQVLGCDGGLYGNSIAVVPGCEGDFESGDLVAFIGFQHGDSDYSNRYGTFGDGELRTNIGATAAALIKQVNTDWSNKEHYAGICPHLIQNVLASLNKIVKANPHEK